MKQLKKFIYLLTAICCVSFSLCSHTASQADTSVTYLALGDSISTGYKPGRQPLYHRMFHAPDRCCQ